MGTSAEREECVEIDGEKVEVQGLTGLKGKKGTSAVLQVTSGKRVLW